MTGASDRWEREQRDRAWLAWHTAALPNQKKFPSADEFIFGHKKKARTAKRQTPEQKADIARQWHAIFSRAQH